MYFFIKILFETLIVVLTLCLYTYTVQYGHHRFFQTFQKPQDLDTGIKEKRMCAGIHLILCLCVCVSSWSMIEVASFHLVREVTLAQRLSEFNGVKALNIVVVTSKKGPVVRTYILEWTGQKISVLAIERG